VTTASDHDVFLEPQAAELPHAEPGPVTAPFWEACRRSELLYQRCGACRAVTFPPLEFCRECQARDQRWARSAGRGVLYSWTVVSRPVTPAFSAPYAPAIVTLDEGYHMVTNIINTTARRLRPDLPVRVVFIDVSGGLVLPYFEPA
jgi:uncharacterized OB-fold protein